MSRFAKPTAAYWTPLLAGAAACSLVATTQADTIELTGTLRDFHVSHPDMDHSHKSFGVRTGIVASQLDAEGKPVVAPGYNLSRAMITSESTFSQWFRDVPGVNITVPYSIVLDNNQAEPGGVYSFAREKGMPAPYQYFFPADGLGWNEWYGGADGQDHNFYFTYELETEFTYTDPAERDFDLTFRFVGDDDVWVFINGQLAVDIGGVHGQTAASINVDDAAASLGLVAGENYQLKLFFAERHRTQSNFRVETTLTLEEVEPTSVSPLYD